MNTKPYTPEQRAADGEIAKAMGWQMFPYMMPSDCYEQHDFTLYCPPGEPIHISTAQPIPRFHESHDARAVLLEWIRAQEWLYRTKFIAYIREEFESSDGEMHSDDLLDMMLATPAQVAEAALKVIKEME